MLGTLLAITVLCIAGWLLIRAIFWVLDLPSEIKRRRTERLKQANEARLRASRASDWSAIYKAYPDHLTADELDDRVAKFDRYLDHSYFDPPAAIVDFHGEYVRLYKKYDVCRLERGDPHLAARRKTVAQGLRAERRDASKKREQESIERQAEIDRQKEDERRVVSMDEVRRKVEM